MLSCVLQHMLFWSDLVKELGRSFPSPPTLSTSKPLSCTHIQTSFLLVFWQDLPLTLSPGLVSQVPCRHKAYKQVVASRRKVPKQQQHRHRRPHRLQWLHLPRPRFPDLLLANLTACRRSQVTLAAGRAFAASSRGRGADGAPCCCCCTWFAKDPAAAVAAAHLAAAAEAAGEPAAAAGQPATLLQLLLLLLQQRATAADQG